MIVTKDLSFALRRDGHKSVLFAQGQRRFEEHGGGSETPGGRTAHSECRSSGSARAIAAQSGASGRLPRWPPPSSMPANQPAAVGVNPDASLFFFGSDNAWPARHASRGRGSSFDSACRPPVAPGGAPPRRSRPRNKSARGHSGCRRAPAPDTRHTRRAGRVFRRHSCRLARSGGREPQRV
jgi:hypothetical protein